MTNNKLASSIFYLFFTLLISIGHVYAESIADLRKQVEQENASAQNKLGKHYYNNGNKSLAETWFRKSANHGYADGQFNLGMIFHEKQQYKEAEKWIRTAAEKGHIKAQINMGSYYYVGRGVNKDDKIAVEWYRKSAENGNALAQDNLGMKYTLGQGVERDYVQAYIWLSLAAMHGDEVAVFHRYILRPKLTTQQLKEARAEVRKRYVELYLK